MQVLRIGQNCLHITDKVPSLGKLCIMDKQGYNIV